MQLILEHAEEGLYQHIKRKGNFAEQLALLVKLSATTRPVPDYQLKVFVNLFAKLLAQEQGNVYLCNDHDIIILTKKMGYSQLEKVKSQIKAWLVEEHVTSGLAESEFYLQLYNLSFNFEDFAQLVEKKYYRQQASATKAHYQITGYKKLIDKLYQMVELTNKLQNASIAPLLRQQKIYLMHGKKVTPVISELHVSLKHLREAYHLKLDMMHDRAISCYLFELLDQRVLPYLATNHADYAGELPLTVNLSLNTIFSQVFTEFNAELPETLKSRISWEIHLNDALYDLKLYHSGVDCLRNLGYNILIDHVQLLSLEQVNREKLSAELVKVEWDSQQAKLLGQGCISKLRSLVEELGSNRVVLTHCSDQDAIDFGKQIGVKLYQGWCLDKFYAK